MSGDKPAFLHHVHSFRAVAIIAVVATHALYDLHWFEKDRLGAKLSVSLVQNGTVLFVFIAGFLFQHRLTRFEYKGYLLTKLKFVIVPYLIVSLPYVLLQWHRHFGIFADWVPRWFHNDVLHVFVAYLSGNQMPIPLWFVPMIAVYYLMAPLFVWLDRHPVWYFCLPALLIFASFAHRPQNQTELIQSVPYFLPVYLCGMCSSHYRERVLDATRRWRWPLVGAVIGLVAFEVAFRDRTGAIESARIFSTERGVFDVNIYMKLGIGLLLLDLLRGASPTLNRILSPAADMSFGIFFLHYYFIYFARDLRVELGAAPWAGGLVNLSIYTLVLVVMSLFVVWALRAILGRHSRYIVGC